MEQIRKVLKIFHSPALAETVRQAKPVRGKVALICALGIVSTLISLGTTLVTRELIDGAVNSQKEDLWIWGSALVSLILISRVLAVFGSLVRTKANARLQKSMQKQLIAKLLGKEYAALKKWHSGELVNRLFSDVGVVKNGILGILPNITRTAVSFFGAAAILLSMDWRFLPVMLLGGLAGLAVVLLFREPMKKRHKRMQEAQDSLHAGAQETLTNVHLIKASLSERRAENKLEKRQEHLAQEQIRQGKFTIWMNSGFNVVFEATYLFCMIWGCIRISDHHLTYGALAALIQLIGRIQGPIASSVDLAGQVYSVISSQERIMELTGLPEEQKGEPLDDFDEIRLKNVNFQYEDNREDVLKNINAVIRKGDFMALTGMSGGGKTSLFQLLLGIYQPTSGSVVFLHNGKEINASRGTRELFAYVPQGNTLFSGTLRENLTLFTDEASEEDIREAIRIACIDDLYEKIGPDAVLGERGVGLSEGQAQRVAVARALLSKAPILLLDEATSALDEETEARMLENISGLRDRTCIIVTHRRAALAICDYALHMEDGSLQRT